MVPQMPPMGSAELLFQELCQKFSIHQDVAEYLVTTMGLMTLEDFRTVITEPSQVDKLITSQIPNLQKPLLQAARLRQAWEAVNTAHEGASASKRKGLEEPDMETLLPAQQLLDLKEAFWLRYKMRYGADRAVRQSPQSHCEGNGEKDAHSISGAESENPHTPAGPR